jgi:Icc protein
MKSAIRFIHISDTHIGPTQATVVNGALPFPRTARLVQALSQLPFKPDFIIHTGDVVADPDENAYSLAQELLSGLPAPLLVVNGNHDSAEGLRRYFLPSVTQFSLATLTYRYDFAGHSFLFLDGNTAAELKTEGLLGESQLRWLENELRNVERASVFVHYAPFAIDCAWTDHMMLLSDGEQLHQLLLKHKAKIDGVFFGHVHSSVQLIRDGILYSSIASPAFRFSLSPKQTTIEFLLNTPISYSIVTIGDPGVTVKEQIVAE